MKLKPLVKWVGGKRRLAPAIVDAFPRGFGRYYEPFCGGAAVFCELVNRGLVKEAVLGDMNAALIDLYRVVACAVDVLLEEVGGLRAEYNAATYEQKERMFYAVRDAWNAGNRRSAFFVFLKTTCFNGLWRENADGLFNVGWGKYAQMTVDAANFRAWSEALRHVELRRESALTSTRDARRGDIVYNDPPYDATFASYVAEGFSPTRQISLFDVMRDSARRGVHVFCSNSTAIEELLGVAWPEATVKYLETIDSVNCDGDGRKKRAELLFYVKHGLTRREEVLRALARVAGAAERMARG